MKPESVGPSSARLDEVMKGTAIGIVMAVTLSTTSHAHSLTTAYCNKVYPQGATELHITVAANGNISGTGGKSATPFTAQIKPDSTVNLLRQDGSIWYENVSMKDGYFYGKYHLPGATQVYDAVIPCTPQ